MKARLTQAIEIAVKPSPLLLGLLCLISILSCWIVILLPIYAGFKLFMLTMIIVSTSYYTLRDALRLLPWSWHRVEVNVDGQLQLINKQGKHFTADLAATSFIHPWLIILNMQAPAWKRRLLRRTLPAVILFADEQQQYRQFRVWLRWWKHQDAS